MWSEGQFVNIFSQWWNIKISTDRLCISCSGIILNGENSARLICYRCNSMVKCKDNYGQTTVQLEVDYSEYRKYSKFSIRKFNYKLHDWLDGIYTGGNIDEFVNSSISLNFPRRYVNSLYLCSNWVSCFQSLKFGSTNVCIKKKYLQINLFHDLRTSLSTITSRSRLNLYNQSKSKFLYESNSNYYM